MKNGERPIANPFVRLREEFDDWAILFDCDTGHGFGLSPTGVYVWKLLDGEHSIDDLLAEVSSHANDVPEEAIEHVRGFIDELAAEGLAGFGSAGFGLSATTNRPEDFSCPPCGQACELSRFKYEPPKLVDLSGRRQAAYGGDCTTGSIAATGNCHEGCVASIQWSCVSGGCAAHCCHGTVAAQQDCNGGLGALFCCQDGTSTSSATCRSGNAPA